MLRVPLETEDRFAPVYNGFHHTPVGSVYLFIVLNTGQNVCGLLFGDTGGKP